MKIFCEFCGAQFESEVANFCPACGAAFSGNDQIEHKLQHQKQLDHLEIEDQKMDLKERQAQIEAMQSRNQNAKISRNMSKGCFVLFAVSVALIVLAGVGLAVMDELSAIALEREEREEHSAVPVITEPEEADVPVSGNFNEPVQAVNYSVICDSFEEIERWPFEPSEGYMYVSFHLIVKNTGVGKIDTTDDIMCLVDGIMMSHIWHSERKDMPVTTLPAGVSAEGNICFEVPVAAEVFELRYGEYVTIYIENDISEREQSREE